MAVKKAIDKVEDVTDYLKSHQSGWTVPTLSSIVLIVQVIYHGGSSSAWPQYWLEQ